MEVIPAPTIGAMDLLPELPDESELPEHSRLKLRKQRRFLQSIRRGGSITNACIAVPISRQAYHHWMDDEVFAAAMKIATEEKWDLVEETGYRLATDGVQEPLVSQGRIVGTKVVYSERLIEFFLKSNRRSTYGDRREISGPDGAPLVAAVKPPEVTVAFVTQVIQLLGEAGVGDPDLLEGESVDSALALAETAGVS